MKKYLVLFLFALTGCATSPNAVKDHHLLNAYNSQKSANEVVEITEVMSNYCSSGLFQPVVEKLPSIGKARMSLKLKNTNAQYYFLVDAENISKGGSLVKIYHYQDTLVTKKMAMTVQDWTEIGNKECVKGF